MHEKMEKKLQELDKEAAKAATIRRLLDQYPDLEPVTDRWHTVRYMSEAANAVADKVEIKHNCGCCNDSPLEARPYVEIEGQQIYSRPDCFRVGEKDPMTYTDRPYGGWEEDMRGKGISDVAIELVRAHFGLCAARLEQEAEEEEGYRSSQIEELKNA